MVGTRPQSGISTPAVNDYGSTVIQQDITLAVATGTGAVSGTIYIPVGSQIIDVIVDTLVAWNSGSSDTFSLGTAAGGTQFASGVSTAATGRVRPTFTAAQLLAMQNVGFPAAVIGTITQGGAAATTGSVVAQVLYVPTVQPFIGAT